MREQQRVRSERGDKPHSENGKGHATYSLTVDSGKWLGCRRVSRFSARLSSLMLEEPKAPSSIEVIMFAERSRKRTSPKLSKTPRTTTLNRFFRSNL